MILILSGQAAIIRTAKAGAKWYRQTLEKIENERLQAVLGLGIIIALFDIGAYVYLIQTIGVFWAEPITAQFFSFIFATTASLMTRQW